MHCEVCDWWSRCNARRRADDHLCFVAGISRLQIKELKRIHVPGAAPASAESVDVLFIDEAGQMSLADVLAVAQGAESLVLLGDPQQLEQPQQASHPPLTTSTPDEAPRGMSFLYSANRLNVATSRAKGLCILVGNPKLFEPDCRTPQQMRLANAFCRYLEMAGAPRPPAR
jgi:superfamily I DNA and/or RNA helicase